MPVVHPRTADVTQLVTAIVAAEVKAAAGNTLLSKAEQATAPGHIVDAAQALRDAGGAHARVTTAELEAELVRRAQTLIGSVNQATGNGAHFVSQAEARRAAETDPALGGRVLRAWEILANRGLDVASIARTKVSAMVTDPATEMYIELPSVAEAERYVDAQGRSVTWLVIENTDALKGSFVWGRNDLWAEKFDISRLDGTITTTAEH